MPDTLESHPAEVEATPEKTSPDEVFSEIGRYCAFDFTPDPHYLSNNTVWVPEEFEDDGNRDTSPLSEDAKKALMELDRMFLKQDVSPRRIEIEGVWKAAHYQRGYQFLLHKANGGWTLPGNGSPFSAGNQQLLSNTYHTNIYGEKGEIIIAALSREVPKVEFFPVNPEHGPDQEMAAVAEDLKDIWAKNNNLQAILQDIASLFYTDDRALLWTRYELNGDEYGYEEEEEPTVPENALMPPTMPTDTEGSEEYQDSNFSPLKSAKRKPRGRVRTTAMGKLDHQVPIYVDGQFQMGCLTIFEDKDLAIARAQFPWMKEKIQGGGDGVGEVELGRIARENVRQAVPGQYVTGDAINRHTVVKHTYIRRAMFFDSQVSEQVREELLDKFPDGTCLVKAGTEFAFARNENMDDHCGIGHPFPGKGQNRRALGDSLLPIQDYANELISLALDFAKRTIAKKWMDSEAFSVEALKKQNNVPGSIGPFQRVPGVAVDQLIFIEPTPTPQPWLITFVQWVVTSLAEQISGALPSLFGAQISGQVGSEGVATQRDQAMQRQGCPWNSIQSMFASAARQAAMLMARCTTKDIDETVPGKGRVKINVNSLKGNVLCYAEQNPEFPESWSQKESRIMSVVDKALASPDSQFSKLVLDPKNLKAIRSAIRLNDFTIKGSASVEKQEAEFEVLLRSGPQPNPAKAKIEQTIQEAQDGIKQHIAESLQTQQEPPPEIQQQVQQAPQMIAMLQQQMQQMPDELSTVNVRGDGSEDDDVEAGICFDWMNSADGRKFENGSPEQKAAFANVHLHWKEHTDAAKKLAAAAAPPPPPPKVSFSAAVDKLPAPEAAAAVSAGGIPANPGDFQQHRVTEANTDISKKVIPDSIWAQQLHNKE
jgi:hypothetical protein